MAGNDRSTGARSLESDLSKLVSIRYMFQTLIDALESEGAAVKHEPSLSALHVLSDYMGVLVESAERGAGLIARKSKRAARGVAGELGVTQPVPVA